MEDKLTLSMAICMRMLSLIVSLYFLRAVVRIMTCLGGMHDKSGDNDSVWKNEGRNRQQDLYAMKCHNVHQLQFVGDVKVCYVGSISATYIHRRVMNDGFERGVLLISRLDMFFGKQNTTS